MVTIEEAQEILDEVAEELPPEIFKELNGGVLLLPDAKLSPEAKSEDLYVMGEYRNTFSMGRYIIIYYGSFEALYGDRSRVRFKRELRKTLRHELTHHLESLAGERDLEIEDEKQMERYRNDKPLR